MRVACCDLIVATPATKRSKTKRSKKLSFENTNKGHNEKHLGSIGSNGLILIVKSLVAQWENLPSSRLFVELAN